jgi:hypothetical protein
MATLLKIDGVYEHIKTGKRYRIIAFGKDEKTLTDMVIYEALYDNSVSKVWIRPKESFVGEAQSPDGTFHPRFRLVEG